MSKNPGDCDGSRGGDAGLSTEEETRAQFDWSETPPAMAVIETVAAAVGRSPSDLDPLYDSLDPEALNVLVRSSTAEDGIVVSLSFAGRTVVIDSRGEVIVRSGELRA